MNGRKTRYFSLLAGAILTSAGLLAMAVAEDLPPESGPDVVILRELENAYEAVPFDHKSHAKMAQMWNGCVTCHHRSPQPAGGAAPTPAETRTQEASAKIPACKSCHPVAPAEVDVHKPSLKGAYHRQCLNCHQEWMHENACVICHKPKEGGQAVKVDPTPDDIVGRMHPPIPEPEVKVYRTRFTPADGANVLFRHREHTIDFGIKCVTCHHRDNCAHCHDPSGRTSGQKPLRPGLTWSESHGPCLSCHQESRCRNCHYKDDHPPPKPFDHWATRQGLDAEHTKLACAPCHPNWRFTGQPSCGDAACHKDKQIEYPTDRPGPVVMTRPAARTGWAAAAGGWTPYGVAE